MSTGPLRVLCIEDEPELREDLVSELRDSGCMVWGAADGLEGLALALSEQFDVVLCDVRMPKLDGLGVLEQLRMQDGASACVPFIFLSAYDDAALREKTRACGADGFLLKPVSYVLLAETLSSICRPGCTESLINHT